MLLLTNGTNNFFRIYTMKVGEGFFATNNYGVYFYLIGSLLFYFQMCDTNKFSTMKTSGILLFFIVVSVFLVYVVQPRFS